MRGSLPAAVLIPAMLAAAMLAAACASPAPSGPSSAGTPPPVDPATAPLLAAHGLIPIGPTRSMPLTVGDPADPPWAVYLEASKGIGLDFRALRGRAGQLRITPVRGPNPDTAAYVLLVDGSTVGAWIGPGGTTSGVLALDDLP